MTDPSMLNQQKPFSNYNEAIAEFNRMFCYVIKENAVVRLSDFAIFRPGRFARSSYVNWFYLTEKNKQRSVARDWLKSVERNQRESVSDLQTERQLAQIHADPLGLRNIAREGKENYHV